MKKMNKTYEAPKAEMVELNVNCAFMDPVVSGGPTWPEEES
jgi:hypothetical protein